MHQWHQENYDIVGNNPLSWFEKAEALLLATTHLLGQCYFGKLHIATASGPLPPEFAITLRLVPTIAMLRGMALENMMKSLLLQAGETLAKDGRYTKVQNTGDHDLCSLAIAVSSRMNLKFNNEERDLLKLLSCWIYAGRYPIQKKVGSPDDLFSLGISISGEDHVFNGLVAKLQDMNVIVAECPNRCITQIPQ